MAHIGGPPPQILRSAQNDSEQSGRSCHIVEICALRRAMSDQNVNQDEVDARFEIVKERYGVLMDPNDCSVG